MRPELTAQKLRISKSEKYFDSNVKMEVLDVF